MKGRRRWKEEIVNGGKRNRVEERWSVKKKPGEKGVPEGLVLLGQGVVGGAEKSTKQSAGCYAVFVGDALWEMHKRWCNMEEQQRCDAKP